jgi:hypothetical protein
VKGVNQIIAMRVKGIAPVMLVLTDNAPVDDKTVQYERQDNPATTDLRFVVGLLVSVEGEDATVVKAWAAACTKAGASRVIWTHFKTTGSGEFRRAETVAMGDTEDLMTWSVQ